ncbi:MAG: hypothetical protein MK086_14660 [Flavobacteriales bacterium]|nr:hypothetical protein [Flavobacteriales bacterium]
MKKSKILLITIGLIICGLTSNAQNVKVNVKEDSEKSEYKRHQSFTLHDDSNNQVIDLQVDEGSNKLKIMVKGAIRDGKMMVELEDPDGNIKGTFAIKSSQSKNKAKGNLEKSFIDPEGGTWRLRIQCKNATGQIEIDTEIRK